MVQEAQKTFYIYHIVGRKVGCTDDLERRMKRYEKKEGRRPDYEVLEVLYNSTKYDAGDCEKRWRSKFGYRGEPHYAISVDSYYAAHVEKGPDGKSVHAVSRGRISARLRHAIKDADGKSVAARQMGAAAHAIKDESGRSITALRASTALHAAKNENGKSVAAVRRGLAAHAIKDENGKSLAGIQRAAELHATKDKTGKSLAAVKGTHQRWHAARGIVSPNCSLCIPNIR